MQKSSPHGKLGDGSGLASAERPVAASQITLDGFRDGSYRVEQWDTYAGRPVMVTTTEAERGRLVVKTPAGLTTDAAWKIRRL